MQILLKLSVLFVLFVYFIKSCTFFNKLSSSVWQNICAKSSEYCLILYIFYGSQGLFTFVHLNKHCLFVVLNQARVGRRHVGMIKQISDGKEIEIGICSPSKIISTSLHSVNINISGQHIAISTPLTPYIYIIFVCFLFAGGLATIE